MTMSATTEKNLDTALLVLRLIAGAIFIMHGYQKVFTYGFAHVTTMFTQIGVPMAKIVAPFICALELVGGFALLFGAFTRVAAGFLACDMLGAILLVHIHGGFFAPKGVEFALGNFGTLVTLALLGAGAYSVDAMLARRRSAAP
jgi:putative oxidoreductase